MGKFFLVKFAFFEDVDTVAAADNGGRTGFGGINHCLGHGKTAFGEIREFKNAHRAVPENRFALEQFFAEQGNRFRPDIQSH